MLRRLLLESETPIQLLSTGGGLPTDPRSAGIGSPESIIQTWSCHREIIKDE